MVNKLPVTLDPEKLSTRRASFKGKLPLSAFHRLSASIIDTEGDVDIVLDFDLRHDGLKVVDGLAKVTLSLNCQRCLSPISVPLELPFRYGFVMTPEKADLLEGDDLEPVIMDENGLVRTVDLIEDELMLAVPLVPRHAIELCDASATQYLVDETEAPQKSAENPFAVLKNMKNQTQKPH